jgi:hypothetical protein
VIEKEIYLANGDLDTWSELGLIRIWDLPQVAFGGIDLQGGISFDEECAAVVCLLCHRLVGQFLFMTVSTIRHWSQGTAADSNYIRIEMRGSAVI